MKRPLIEGDFKIVDKNMNRCLMSLVISEIRIKTTSDATARQCHGKTEHQVGDTWTVVRARNASVRHTATLRRRRFTSTYLRETETSAETHAKCS
mgnify:CR=1 FL=1